MASPKKDDGMFHPEVIRGVFFIGIKAPATMLSPKWAAVRGNGTQLLGGSNSPQARVALGMLQVEAGNQFAKINCT